MALISVIENFKPKNDPDLLQKAEALKPALIYKEVLPRAVYPGGLSGEAALPACLPDLELGKGDSLLLDFGEHLVGRVTLKLDFRGSHPDAPAWLSLTFAETPWELSEDPETYAGWVSGSWIQQETLHVDLLPAALALPRRYAFRYLRITVRDTSPKYRLRLSRAVCRTETSADADSCLPPPVSDPELSRIYAVSCKTLMDCMQTVFEDGPKRDRRLWMGDLRLEALANYASFRNTDLVKRCLYLFGGTRFPDGRISACLFTAPEPEADDTFLFDYALMYPVALEEYLRETGDQAALRDLYDVAMEQIEYGLAQCDKENRISPRAAADTFIDWNEDLDKTACAQGVLIYALDYAAALALRMGDSPRAARLRQRQGALREAGKQFWSEDRSCFLSNGQASPATQIWMTLAGVPTDEQAIRALEQAPALSRELPMQTPYLHHYYVAALLKAGLRETAVSHIKAYWGSMLEAGADTFWEAWDPERPDFSPYGGTAVNSYCHAWSCGPAHLLRQL